MISMGVTIPCKKILQNAQIEFERPEGSTFHTTSSFPIRPALMAGLFLSGVQVYAFAKEWVCNDRCAI